MRLYPTAMLVLLPFDVMNKKKLNKNLSSPSEQVETIIQLVADEKC